MSRVPFRLYPAVHVICGNKIAMWLMRTDGGKYQSHTYTVLARLHCTLCGAP